MKIQNTFTNFIANTLLYGRSLWQIVASRLRRKDSLADILNYRYISDKLATSGQPTAEEFSLIHQAGYQTVLNLAPPTASNALPEEQEIVTSLGMDYINIPVVWDNPTMGDFTSFCAVMKTHKDRPIFAHCAMNMRVSAFVYLHRHLIEGISESEAYASMIAIWKPNPTWQKFIETGVSQCRNLN